MRAELETARRVLSEGGVVAFPTDTVWGLLAHPGRPEAVAKVYRLKERPRKRPLQLLIPHPGRAAELAEESEGLRRLAELFWPGPLTVVVPARRGFPELGAERALGLRVPDHPELALLISSLGGALAATSLNKSGRPPARSRREAEAIGADYTYPHGEPAGVASTVVDLTGPAPRVLREGAVPAAAVMEALGL